MANSISAGFLLVRFVVCFNLFQCETSRWLARTSFRVVSLPMKWGF